MLDTRDQPPSLSPPPPDFVAPNPAPSPSPSYPPTTAVAPPAAATDPTGRTATRIAGIALLAATALLLVAALTKSWFTAGTDGGVGLLGLERCRGALCQTATWFDIKRIPAQIPIFATVALIATLGAVAFSIHTGVMLVRNRPEAVRIKWLSQLLGLAAFGMIAFVFSLSIGEWSRGLSLGWSTLAGAGGLVAAAVVTAVLVRPIAARST